MNFILAIVFPIITAGVLSGVLVLMARKVKTGSEEEVPRGLAKIQEEVQQVEEKLTSLVIDPNEHVSRAQFEYASESLGRLQSAISAARSELKTVEADLDTTQTEVEEREIKIQSLKGSKEEEAKLLLQIGQEFQLLNQEAENLQTNLSDSLENIKKLEGELTLTQEQSDQLAEFQKLVTNTVSRLKELAVEGQEVERRLKVLSQQYRSLEEEYTKLVEQQFA